MTRSETLLAAIATIATIAMLAVWRAEVKEGDALRTQVADCAGPRPSKAAWDACLGRLAP